MLAGIRGPLRLLAIAFAASAALVFLQSLVLRAIPYDASYFGVAAGTFRAAFVAADLASFLALVVLGRRVPSVYPFTTLGVVLVGITIVAAITGWVASFFSPAGAGASLGGIEPMLSFGASLLVAFTIAAALPANAAPDPRRRALFYVAVAGALLVVFFRVAVTFDRRGASMAIAWARWALSLVPLAALAAFALLTSRTKEIAELDGAGPSNVPARADVAGYRAPGEGAAIHARPDLAAPSPETIAPLRAAVAGIGLHRLAYCVRIGIIAFAAIAALVTFGMFAIFILPFVGAATSVAIVVGVVRQRRLATFHGGAAFVAAIVAFSISAFADAVALVWTIAEVGSHIHMGEVFLAHPVAMFSGGAGVLFVSRAHERAGDLLFRYRLAGLARWTQGLVVLTTSAWLAVFAAAVALDHRGGSSDALGPALAIGFVLLGIGSLLAVIVLHILTLGEAQKVLKERLDKATTP